ncbi:MAG: helix-turn-helix transcriptional regulator [Candidatus Marithrix sp.]|nr:helix-turn-helix transcriptional regulator [Candidatus Marithrix sp.]
MNDYKLLKSVGNRIRYFRKLQGLSQENFAFMCNLDRTYISDIERGKRNVSLINLDIIATALQIPLYKIFLNLPTKDLKLDFKLQNIYKINNSFQINCGFHIDTADIVYSALITSIQLEELPFTLFDNIDLKSLSGIVGAFFINNLANKTNAIINPIEKGHPDIIPAHGKNATEKQLRNFPAGLEVKCTVGNLKKDSFSKVGQKRLQILSSLTWQSHHREVASLMGLVIDFSGNIINDKKYPIITGIFYSNQLNMDDWGKISGITGRNTKVTGMLISGKEKMGKGWVILLNKKDYILRYESILKFNSH